MELTANATRKLVCLIQRIKEEKEEEYWLASENVQEQIAGASINVSYGCVCKPGEI